MKKNDPRKSHELFTVESLWWARAPALPVKVERACQLFSGHARKSVWVLTIYGVEGLGFEPRKAKAIPVMPAPIPATMAIVPPVPNPPPPAAAPAVLTE